MKTNESNQMAYLFCPIRMITMHSVFGLSRANISFAFYFSRQRIHAHRGIRMCDTLELLKAFLACEIPL